MSMRQLAWQGLLLAVLASGLGTVALSKGKDKGDQAVIREALQRGEVLPLDRILAIATAKVPGEVIKVELALEGKKPKADKTHASKLLIYEIKVLTAEGRVRELEIDARSGTVLKVEDD